MAAEAVVSLVVEQLAGLLLKQAGEEIDLLTGLEKKVLKLSNTFKRIQDVLDDAEQRRIKEKTVKAWLQDLEDVSYEIDDVLDEWNYILLKQGIEGTRNSDASVSIHKQRVCSFIPSSCFCFKQVVVRRDIAIKIKELDGKLDLIEKEKNKFSFINSNSVASNSQEWKPVNSTSLIDESEVLGRDSHKNTLVSQMLSGSRQEEKYSVQIFSIIGTGGIGKTALAQLAYNDDRVKGHFEQRGWVCVSNPFEEVRVAKAIVESLGLSSSNLNEFDSLLQHIRDSTFGKRFLLVLDDVWTEDQMKWEPFKNSLKHGAPGSIILLTTRNERVARVASATSMINLGLLSDSDSWSLFRQVAFFGRTKIECERLENIGREIVKKCKGLPLAIKTMGSLLRFKNAIEEWQNVMDSNMWELKGVEVELFPHLYLSYNDLPSPMRRCFSYCAVFPKDKGIKVDDLIRIWTAEGYLNSSGSEDDMELRGRDYFQNLAMRSFFQDFKKDSFEERIVERKMHDIVHDFAQFLTKNECLIIEGERKEKFCENARHLTWLVSEEDINTLPDCNIGQSRSVFVKNLDLDILISHLLNSLKSVRVLSLDMWNLKELPSEIGNLIHLRYLHLGGDHHSMAEFPRTVCEFYNLRTLSLQRFTFEQVPVEIGNLIHLRYLDLSYNRYLKVLPRTIYDLVNLRTLNLEACMEIKELPPGIEKLTKLRHLIIDYVKYHAGIGELTCLQTLNLFSVGREWNNLGYLKNLNQLRGSLQIDIINDLDYEADAKNVDLKSKKHIQSLTIEFNALISVEENVMEALEPSPNLQSLKVGRYGGTQLPKWMASLNNLRELVLNYCFGLMSLPLEIGKLPSLELLMFGSFTQLKIVGSAYFGKRESLSSPSSIGFPKLKELVFSHCRKWEEWEDISPEEEEEDDTVPLMPRLCQISIDDCPKLKALPHRLLSKASSLEFINLDGEEYNLSTILSTSLTLAEIKAGRLDHQSTEEATALE